MKENKSSRFLNHAFTDLMASLAVIFILLTVVFIRNASQKSQEGKDAVRTSLAEVLDRNDLPLEQDQGDPLTMKVRVGEKLLKFPLNSASLSSQAENFITDFFPSLATELCSDNVREKLDAVVIEGHTDRSGESMKEGGTGHNIQLSQNRSFSVLSRALSSVHKDPKLYACILKLVTASGRGSSMPILTGNQYDADLSRRVEIKIRVKSNEQEFFSKQNKKL